MPERCLLYYITDRSKFAGDERARRRALLEKIAEAARAGVDYIQLREKDLSARELELLAREAAGIIREKTVRQTSSMGGSAGQPAIRLLINSHTDVALAAGADGIHLRSEDVPVSAVRTIWEDAFRHKEESTKNPVVAVSCHSVEDVIRAEKEGADFVVFAPVFEKRDSPQVKPQGLAALREACKARIPVLALGGVTLENAASCLECGAAGIAGIRLFQENKVADVARALQEQFLRS